MKTTRLKALTTAQQEAVNRLITRCARADGTRTEAETEPDPSFCCFFYLTQDPGSDCPAAFLSCMLPCDGGMVFPDATFTLHVRPDLRRQGIGTRLYRRMIADCCRLAGTSAVRLHTSTSPDGAGLAAARAVGFHIDVSHLLMNLALPVKNADVLSPSAENGDPVTLSACRNRRLLASLYRRIFLVPSANARTAIAEILELPQAAPFVLFHCEKAVGLAMLLIEADSAYLFNFGILPEYRRRHLARAMFGRLLPLLPKSVQNLQLQVDRENQPALLLYQSLGFCTVTELLELSTFQAE